MILNLSKNSFTDTFSQNDIKYALIDAKLSNALVELLAHVRKENADYECKEIMHNSNEEIRASMLPLFEEKISERQIARLLDVRFHHTNKYENRRFDKSEQVELNGSSFSDIEDMVLKTNQPSFIIDFAKSYVVNDEKFMAKLSKLSPVYVKAYKMNVLNSPEFERDDLQNL